MENPNVIALVLLAVAAASDTARRVIPNTVSALLAAGGAAASLAALGPAGAAWSALAAALVFAGGAGLFGLGIVGGGDVKLAAAAALWMPAFAVPGFLLLTSLAGGALALAYGGLRFAMALRAGGGAGAALAVARRAEAPYGVAIASAAAATLWAGPSWAGLL